PVGLDHPHQHLAVRLLAAAGGAQHLVGLADPRRHAEEHLEPAAPGLGRFGEQGVGIGAAGLVRSHQALGLAFGRALSRARLVISTFTCGWPRKPSIGPCVWSAITLRTMSGDTPRALATRSACSSA